MHVPIHAKFIYLLKGTNENSNLKRSQFKSIRKTRADDLWTASFRRILILHLNFRVELSYLQSNHEGELIDYLHSWADKVDGIVFNLGAYTHTSVAIADAIHHAGGRSAYPNVHAREAFRVHSCVAARLYRNLIWFWYFWV